MSRLRQRLMRLKSLCKPCAGQDGMALILVVWVVTLLTIIVTEFTFSTRTEMSISRNFKEDAQCYYLALAGFNKGITEILNPLVECIYANSDGKSVFQHKKSVNEKTGQEEDAPEDGNLPQRENVSLSAGTYSYEIIDEESKIDLNKIAVDNEANRNVLKRLLEQGAGMGDSSDRDAIIDAIFDWVDKDDLVKLNGAEDEYYQGLPAPYDCKDGPFYTVDELLLVKGITPAILYGAGYIKRAPGENVTEDAAATATGIAKYLTVWTGKPPNQYTADAATLKIYYGEDAGESMKKNLFDEDGQLLNDCHNKSRTFSIIAHGTVGSMSHYIFGVVSFESKKNLPGIRYLFWNDNYIPPQQASG